MKNKSRDGVSTFFTSEDACPQHDAGSAHAVRGKFVARGQIAISLCPCVGQCDIPIPNGSTAPWKIF
ncbi:MAG: hypothetical protein LBH58_03205 [Tannerellaceae bacterium]|nr:hypothetical protein [Tannerellaceae bacterium]